MSFSYNFGANPSVDIPRLLISDTQNTTAQPCIFQDEEILTIERIVVPGVWQSSMFFSGVAGTPTLPSQPVNYLRTAAYLLNSMAANQALMSGVIQLLDVKLDVKSAAAALQKQAQCWLEIDDNAMAFVIIEQVHDTWSFEERFWSQIQRQSSGV